MSNPVFIALVVSMVIVALLVQHWRRTGVSEYLYASYAIAYIGAITVVASWWAKGIGRGVAGIIYLVVTAPMVVWLHRREVRKYGRP